MMSDNDPFIEVKEDVEKALKKAKTLFNQFNESISLKRPESEIKKISTDLRTLLKLADEDLLDLDETIKVVQVNPENFNLDKSQVEQRKAFITQSKKDIQDMRIAINNPNAHLGGEKGMRDALLSRKVQDSKDPREKSNTKNFYEKETGTQAQIMKEQDKEIQAVASTVVNLKEIATVMGNELDEQSRLIDNIELKVDHTTNNLDSGLKRMKEFINANADSKQQVCIVGLIILLVVLLVLLFTL